MANEKRLIDANALMESKWWDSLKDDFDKARAKIIVQSCPTVDAVGVVHGKWIEGKTLEKYISDLILNESEKAFESNKGSYKKYFE